MVVSLVALLALGVFWRASQAALTSQGQAVATQQIRGAVNVLSLREDLRLQNVNRFAGELAARAEIRAFFLSQDRSGVAAALAGTSFGEGGKNVGLVDRRGNRVWGPNLQQDQDSAVRSAAIVRALGGRSELQLLQPEDPVLPDFGVPRGEVPVFVALAPIFDNKDVLGLVVVSEPLAQDFFQNLAQLVSVKVSFPGSAANFGNVPEAAMKVPQGPPQYFETPTGAVFAQRIEFRAPPSFLLGDAVAAVDASSVADRRRSLDVYFVAALLPLLSLVVLCLRRRS